MHQSNTSFSTTPRRTVPSFLSLVEHGSAACITMMPFLIRTVVLQEGIVTSSVDSQSSNGFVKTGERENSTNCVYSFYFSCTEHSQVRDLSRTDYECRSLRRCKRAHRDFAVPLAGGKLHAQLLP